MEPGGVPKKQGNRARIGRIWDGMDGPRRMPDGFGIQLSIHTRALRLTAKSMPIREGLAIVTGNF